MAGIAALLDQALRAAGIPIVGVSVGTDADRLSWNVQFDPSATPAHRTQAATILATLATDASALHAQDQRDVRAFLDAMPLVEQAINLTILDQVNLLRSKLPVPLVAVTAAQWIAAVKQKVDSL